MVLVEP